jgi:tRNA U34 5-carboxymethylaminomethyl modifying GTPase MnmE/TrmE
MNGAVNPAIDALMEMTGLEKVKEQVLAIKDVVDTANRQGVALKNRYNLALLGNPETGKSLIQFV